MFGLSLLILPVLVFVVFSVRMRPAKNAAEDSVALSIDIHRQRLKALKTQFDEGTLTEAEYQSFKLEEEKALLADSRHQVDVAENENRLPLIWVPILLVVVLGASYFVYASVGAMDAVNVQQQFQQLSSSNDLDPEAVESAIEGYQKLLSSDPQNIEGWFQLARMQMDVQQYQPAFNSFSHLLTELRKLEHNAEDEATILAYMGQIKFSLGQLDESLAIFEESLQFGKSNTALGLAGRVSYELGQYEKSIEFWQQLKVANPNSDTQIIDGFISQSIEALKAQGIEYDPGLQVNVQLTLPTAWEGLTADALLFVYARPVGQRMPIVAKRLRVTGQNMDVILSERDSMSGAGFDGLDEIEITARVSLTGIANQQPGDWEADVVIVDLSEEAPAVSLLVSQP